MRYLSFFALAWLCLVGGVATTNVARAADEPDTVDSLRKQKVEVAQKRFAAVDDAYGDGSADLGDVYTASVAWKNAASAMSKEKKDKQTALEAHRDRMIKIYNEVHDLYKTHAEGGEEDKEQTAKFWVLEAKLWVAEAAPADKPK